MYKGPVSPAQSLAIASRRLEILKARYLEFFGIGPAQRQVLLLIIANPGIPQSYLARMLKKDKSTINRLVKKLGHARLVTKMVSRTDRRHLALFPTNIAKVSGKMFSEETSYLDTIIAHGLSTAEVEQLDNLLRRTSAIIQHVLDLPPGEVFPPLFEPLIPR